jgi:hydrogenase expression/formation protein HypC
MCVGIPMKVVESSPGSALCETRDGTSRRIDTMLIGEQPVGTWLLTFLDTAREVLSAEQAAQISNALQAVEMALQGDANIDHLFQDLIDREPELPAFLRSANDTPDKGE